MTITLNPEIEEYVQEQARRHGLHNADAYVEQVLQRDRVRQEDLPTTDEIARMTPRQAAEALGRFGRGRYLRPDLTVKNLINEGRRL